MRYFTISVAVVGISSVAVIIFIGIICSSSLSSCSESSRLTAISVFSRSVSKLIAELVAESAKATSASEVRATMSGRCVGVPDGGQIKDKETKQKTADKSPKNIFIVFKFSANI